MIPTIAHALQLVHTIRACETTRAGFDSPNTKAGRTAANGGIFSSHAIAPPMGGVAGGRKPCRFLCAGLSTRYFRPPTGLTASERGLTAHKGGHAMAALPIPAHSAHTFPQTEKAARRAVRRWFAGTPYLSLAEWRDQARLVHCACLPANPAREAAFDQAFAQELAAVIAGGVSHA